jgi:SAM-dependent methyltransferase
MSYESVTGHRSMALDRVRNDAYADALARVITPDSVVLDLGSGLGIHGLLAARLGACRVYLVEPEDVIAVAEESARVNGLDDVIRVLHGRLEDVEIPERVDVIVSVLTGNLLVTEDLLPVLFRARDRYLKPGGHLIPDRATLDLAPVTAPEIFTREIAAWGDPQHGVTLSPARSYAANAVHFRWDRSAVDYLADPTPVHTLDLMVDDYTAVHGAADFHVHTAGLCHGLAGWFTMRLGERWLSTAPDADPTHWSPAWLPLDPPIPLSAGDAVRVLLDRAPYGDWTWRVSHPGGTQRHSTLLASPIKATTLRKAAVGYAPTLNEEGRAVHFVLSHCSGSMSVVELSTALQRQWPNRYETPEEALRFVQRIVKTLT